MKMMSPVQKMLALAFLSGAYGMVPMACSRSVSTLPIHPQMVYGRRSASFRSFQASLRAESKKLTDNTSPQEKNRIKRVTAVAGAVPKAMRTAAVRTALFAGKPILLATRPVRNIVGRSSRKEGLPVIADEDDGACVLWDQGEQDTGTWPSRSWYLCTSKPSQVGTTCKLLEEEIPGFEGQPTWACSVPNFDLAEDNGSYYDEMMA